MSNKKKQFDINNWQAVKVQGAGWEVKVQVGPRRWLTVCDVYCLTQGRTVYVTDGNARLIAGAPRLLKAAKNYLDQSSVTNRLALREAIQKATP